MLKGVCEKYGKYSYDLKANINLHLLVKTKHFSPSTSFQNKHEDKIIFHYFIYENRKSIVILIQKIHQYVLLRIY